MSQQKNKTVQKKTKKKKICKRQLFFVYFLFFYENAKNPTERKEQWHERTNGTNKFVVYITLTHQSTSRSRVARVLAFGFLASPPDFGFFSPPSAAAGFLLAPAAVASPATTVFVSTSQLSFRLCDQAVTWGL